MNAHAKTPPSFATEGPTSAGVDEKGRVAVPAGYVRQLRAFRRREAATAGDDENNSKKEEKEEEPEELKEKNADESASDETEDEKRDDEQLRVYFTINDDRSLRLYPPCAWRRFVEQLEKRVADNPDDVDLEDYYHAIVGAGTEGVLDRQNRVRIPDYFASNMLNVGKKGKVTFMGIANYMLLFEEKDSSDFIRSAVSRYRRSRSQH
jgi:DNA-binding transcriptional regulator/RsmH inhibitor MraZ